jgi:hypothetical protein
MASLSYFKQNYFLYIHWWGNYNVRDFYLSQDGLYYLSNLARIPEEYPKERFEEKEGTLVESKINQINNYLIENIKESEEKTSKYSGCEIIFKKDKDTLISIVNNFEVYNELRLIIDDYTNFFEQIDQKNYFETL